MHAEKRQVPFKPADMFSLVAEVERYPEFLPWCVGARVRSRSEQVVQADLIIGFKMFRERFTSIVSLDRPNLRIDVRYADGPFKHLANHWQFEDAAPSGSLIDFYVDFEFRNRLLQKTIETLFEEATRRMVSAFEARAQALFGQVSVANGKAIT